LQLQDKHGTYQKTIFLKFVDLRVFKFCIFYISRWMLVIFISLPLYHNLVVTTIIKQIKSENLILSFRLVLKLWSPLTHLLWFFEIFHFKVLCLCRKLVTHVPFTLFWELYFMIRQWRIVCFVNPNVRFTKYPIIFFPMLQCSIYKVILYQTVNLFLEAESIKHKNVLLTRSLWWPNWLYKFDCTSCAFETI